MSPRSRAAGGLDAAAWSRLGTTVGGKWHLDTLLGVGGTSAVYSGTHRNGSRAAIKLIRSDLALDARARARLLREARVANSLARHGAVAVIDDCTEGEDLFLVMELLDGMTLAAALRSAGGHLDRERAVELAMGILRVLSPAHDRGIVHRDVKPENVFITCDGGVRLLDFGLASAGDDTSLGDSLTRSGVSLGTPAFMSSEQARGRRRDIGPATDVWGVGATLFTILSGRHVHEGETVGETLFLAGSRRAAPVATVVAGLPPRLAAIIDRALAFDTGDRFPTAGAMLAALEEAQITPSPVSLEPASSFGAATIEEASPRQPRRRAVQVILRVGAFGLGVAALGSRHLLPTLSRTPAILTPGAEGAVVATLASATAPPDAEGGVATEPQAVQLPLPSAVGEVRAPSAPATPAGKLPVSPRRSAAPAPGVDAASVFDPRARQPSPLHPHADDPLDRRK